MNRGGWLGFLFFVALILLGFATLMVKDKAFSFLGSGSAMYVRFDNVKGLRAGNEVRVDGVLLGKVKEIKLQSAVAGAMVILSLDEPVTIYEDGTVLIESSSVLGGDMVTIHRGKKTGKWTKSSDYKDPEHYFQGDVRAGLSDVGDLASDNRENIRQLIANLKDLSQSLKEGQGTIGKLLKSDELHKETVDTIKSAREAIGDARTEIKKVGDSVIENFNKITRKLDEGQGPAVALLNDKKMTDKLDRILTNVEDTSKNLKEITDTVKKGDGALGKMVNDKEMGEKIKNTIDNVERVSESLKNVSNRLEAGEGSVGRLLQDDELYEQAHRTLEDVDKFFGRASRSVIEIVTDYKDYLDTKMSISKIGIRIGPDEDKYIFAGASVLGLDKTGTIRFEKQIKDNENDSIFKPEAMLAYRAAWMLDHRLTIRGGFMEGKPGGGVDFLWEDWGLFSYPVQFTFEIRDAYNSVEKEHIDEEIAGPLMRAYVKLPLWIRRGTWVETLMSTVKLQAGVNRIAKDPEFFVGIAVEWPDEDIRTLVGLLGAAR